MASGLDPAAMALTEIDSTLSCVSKDSIVDMGTSVMYASPDGLVMATESGLRLITEDLLTRDQWQEFVPLLSKASIGKDITLASTIQAL